MPAAANHASRVSFTQFGTGTVRMCLANEIHDGPTFFTALQTIECQLCELAAAQSATKQDSQHRSITLSRKSPAIGRLPEGQCFIRR
jgi:hypothetical protein